LSSNLALLGWFSRHTFTYFPLYLGYIEVNCSSLLFSYFPSPCWLAWVHSVGCWCYSRLLFSCLSKQGFYQQYTKYQFDTHSSPSFLVPSTLIIPCSNNVIEYGAAVSVERRRNFWTMLVRKPWSEYQQLWKSPTMSRVA
jgi:hypothetical protein